MTTDDKAIPESSELLELSDALARVPRDGHEVAQIAAESTAETLDVFSDVRLWDKGRETLVLEAAAAHGHDSIAGAVERGLQSFDPGAEPFAGLIERAEAITFVEIPDPLRNELGPLLGGLADAGARGVSVVPLVARDEFLGVMAIVSPAPLTDDDLRFLRGVADRVALALDNAQLCADLQREIEQRRQAEGDLHAELGETAARLQRLANRVQDVVYRIRLAPEPAGEYLSASVEQVTGYAVGDFFADPDLFRRIIHPDDQAAMLTRVAQAQPGRRDRVRVRWVRKDGAVIWVEHQTMFEFDETGTPTAIEGIARDVTDTVRDELRTETLLAISDAMTGARLDLDRVLDAAVSAIVPFLGIAAGIVLVEPRSELLELRALAAPEATETAFRDVLHGLNVGVEPLASLLMTGEPMLVGDLGESATGREYETLHDAGVRGYLNVALRVGSESLGILSVARNADQGAHTEADIAFLGQIAERVAIAIDNAEMHARAQSEITERKRMQWKLASANAALEREVTRRRAAQDKLLELTDDLDERVQERTAENTLLAKIVETTDDAVIALASDAMVTSWNLGAQRVFGYTADEAAGRTIDFLVPDGGEALLHETLDRAHLGETIHYATEAIRKDGQRIWVAGSLSPVSVDDGERVSAIIARDITEQKELEATEARLAERRGVIADFSRALAETPFDLGMLVHTVGATVETALGCRCRIEVPDPGDAHEIVSYAASGPPIDADAPHSAVIPLRHQGRELGVLVACRSDGPACTPGELDLLNEIADRAALAVANCALVDETKRELSLRALAESKLSDLATELMRRELHDDVTGLPKRALLAERLEHAITSGDASFVLCLDLDRFKTINEGIGHTAGDDVLRTLGQRLVRAVGARDLVACLGGDEFCIMYSGVSPNDVQLVAAEALAIVEAPVNVADREIAVSASIGAAAIVGDGLSADIVLRRADAALRHAKRLGGSRYVLYDDSLRPQIGELLKTEEQLREALETGQLSLHYQPIYRADRLSIEAVEALLRWEHPTRGLVSAAKFVPLAEESGLILPIGEWVIGEACREVLALREICGSDATLPVVHVNVSGRQLARPGFSATVMDAIGDTGIDPSSICLELTESTLLREPHAAEELTEMSKAGVRIAVDDFGVEYSSMSHIKRLPIDVLKIDKAFVSGLDRDATDVAIARAIITLAHSIDIVAIAEGVETDAQLQRLIALDCDLLQGYGLSRPVSAAQFADLIRG